MSTARQDLQHALRAIRRTPTLSVVVTLALALGIGATTALFGVVDALFLSPFPYMSPAAVVRVFDVQGDVHQLAASFPEYSAAHHGSLSSARLASASLGSRRSAASYSARARGAS